ncbi:MULTISPECIES: FecR domain-containing protein [Pseudomonas aeruginosa group]|uniref:FecR domain-containing protein n=1 Tax=Pseudomonas aeruginosa group TaxID=136841 RepID=UPI0006B28655|nr:MULTISPECIES: FecR family protein [Pseudomonas aeruginosa group]KPD29026.1 iron dicitrate transport regulator FecR [Pseudomonas paraeruginosa]KQB32838.1 iron dicitrate transport regulator FecR [Pseudomonas paraeruginosa]MDT1026989.1 FecR family protein [Pseudomonas paraeruginosa]PHJ31681.1 iron dicitrate transport regulator FecR [Pseudomonas paraeruginosa]QQV48066.1 FecR family protein [Pseudomonas aeruginosa]
MTDATAARAQRLDETGFAGPPAAEAIAPQVLGEAASWLLLMQEGPLAPAQQAELESWRLRSAEHQRAWRRAERLLANIGSLPPALARRTLERPGGSGRRAVLRGLALFIGGAPLAWWGWRAQLWRDGFGADHLTAVGERRHLTLEDGSQVEMNTDSALDLRYDAGQRLLRLYRGEIYIRTAADRREPPRPFLVRTEQGLMRALGTAFSVRREGTETVLAVYEGAVQVRPEDAASAADGRVIEAGQRVRFDRQRIGPVESAGEAALAWRQGLLVADEMPLRQWAGELMRYGSESIECEPSLGPLRVSGTFPVDDLPLALAMLAQTHGLRLVHQGRRVLIRR